MHLASWHVACHAALLLTQPACCCQLQRASAPPSRLQSCWVLSGLHRFRSEASGRLSNLPLAQDDHAVKALAATVGQRHLPVGQRHQPGG